MTLRTRLTLVGVVLVIVVSTTFAVTIVRQRSVLVDQIDGQLDAVAVNIARGVEALDTSDDRPTPGRPRPPTGELWFVIIEADGTQTTIARPVSRPEFAPDLDLEDHPRGEPFSAGIVDGSGRARAILIDLPEGRVAAAAVSTADIDDIQRQLLITSALAVALVAVAIALGWFWIDRLSLRPIKSLTGAAEEIASGRRTQRVEHLPARTEAGRLGIAFNAMVDARQRAEDRQRRFVADASHELRTPLTSLRGYTALHRQGGLTEPGQVDDAMRRIGSEAERMAALVEDLLTLASLDDARPLRREQTDLTRLLTDVAADASVIQPDRLIDATGVAPGLTASADSHLLTQAITALTTNALRHTPSTAALTIDARRHGDRVRIRVTDTGPGISPDHLERIFERFHRGDSAGARPAGTGLGLAIARSIIERHDGRLTAESTLGSGTTFTIELPVD